MLKTMPCIQVRPINNIENINISVTCDLSTISETNVLITKYCFEVSNIGHDIAKNITYKWNCNLGESMGTIYSLPVGEKKNDLRNI